LLIGAVFFFPGLWKLRASGLGWILSDNLRDQIYWKWAITPGLQPAFRIDRFPTLLRAGAGAVVFFELTFGFAVWARRLRLPAVAAALVFHAAARLLMGIDFSGLWLAYVVFVDWDALARWAGLPTPPAPATATATATARFVPALCMGAFLLAGAVEAGARGATTGWPFACYPTFQDIAGTEMPALVVTVVDPAGNETAIDGMAPPAEDGNGPRERAFGLRLLAQAGAPGAADRFAAYWRRLSARPALASASPRIHAVRFYAGRMSTLPEQRALPARRTRLLYELLPAADATMMPRARSGAITSSSSEADASAR